MNSERKAFDDDASMEILLRLPIKCVIRFQIVSKNWLSLISSNHFRHLHTLRHHNLPPPCHIFTKLGPSLCYLNFVSKPTKIIPLSFNIPSNCRIVSCCNGLMVMRRNLDFHVHNPITRQSRKITLPRTGNKFYVSNLNLVFDPSKSPHYKIVYFRGEHGSKMHTMDVFSSESGRWKACVEAIVVPSEFCVATSIYCNNKIYGTKWYEGDGSLYCINIDTNVLTFLASPMAGMQTSYIHSIQEWNGYLYYSAIYKDNDSGRYLACLWEKDKDDDKWCLKYEDRLPPVRERFFPVDMSFFPQTSTLLIPVRPREIMAYCFLDKSCNQLLDFSRLKKSWGFGDMHPFRETLAPI